MTYVILILYKYLQLQKILCVLFHCFKLSPLVPICSSAVVAAPPDLISSYDCFVFRHQQACFSAKTIVASQSALDELMRPNERLRVRWCIICSSWFCARFDLMSYIGGDPRWRVGCSYRITCQCELPWQSVSIVWFSKPLAFAPKKKSTADSLKPINHGLCYAILPQTAESRW